ncbi:MAG: D-xylose 1-dehydrogenase [Acidobacteriaceae bacterium]|jgi:D-xylose 1-dehydrogenase|nr:D-xylose 1-dehydrogenase [Acidobacteriaceae bacterium]
MENKAVFATYPSLVDRVVVVTGGATGIGESIIEAFAEQQARTVFLDIEDAAAEQLIQRLGSSGYSTPAYHHCDLADTDALQQTIGRVLQQFGTVDILVNNAANDMRHSIEEVTSFSWDRSMAINLKPQFFMAQGVIPAMRKAKRGSIINMSSIGWLIPSTRMPAYVTAKAAIVGLTRTLAHELGADNIRVNCVLPGAILTQRQKRLWFTPAYEAEILASQAIKRMIHPEEVARLVLFLAADDSSAITNQSYIIDGGWI